jgi:membrane protein DedA with SNARE-associated domain
MRSHAFVFERRFNLAEQAFQKHGAWAVFAGRFVLGLRIIVSLLAGALKMRFFHFFLLNATGALVWAATMGSVGYAIGSSWRRIITFVRDLDWTVLILVIATAVTLFLRSRMRVRDQGD